MNSLTFTIVCLMCFVNVYGGFSSLIKGTGHKNHPGFCYLSGSPSVFIKVGVSRKLPNGQCGMAKCTDNYSIELTTCQVPEDTTNCEKISGNSRKMYPQCCDRYICEKDNKISPNKETVK